jgi:hypothetical protein
MFLTLFAAAALLTAAGCSSTASEAEYNSGANAENIDGLQKSVPAALTPEETAGLIHMREEEKLARDVYTALNEKWNLRVFKNIIQSEQTHMSAVLNLLNRYSIPDPAENNPYGKFTDKALQDLYDKLVIQGSESIAAAMQTGVDIETLDIKDLQEQIDKYVQRPDILRVYGNLKAASENHLNAFTVNLERFDTQKAIN